MRVSKHVLCLLLRLSVCHSRHITRCIINLHRRSNGVVRSECGNKAGPQLLRWTANSPSACDNGRLIANTLKMFYLSPADFYLKLPLYPAGEIVGVFLVFFFSPLSPRFHGRLLFLTGHRVQRPNKKEQPWQSVRGYDKKALQ